MYGVTTFINSVKSTATTIDGDAIYGGTITLGGSNNVNGQLTVKNASGSVTAQLNNNGLYAIAGSIGDFNISSALYSGSHSTVDSKNVGAYVGNNGISYVTTTKISGEKFLVQLGYGSSSTDYSESIKAIQIARSYQSSNWDNTFLLTCDGSLYCDNIEIAPGNNEFGLLMYDMDQRYPCKFYVDTIGTLHIKPEWNVFIEDGLSAYDIDCTSFYNSGDSQTLGKVTGVSGHNLVNNSVTSGQTRVGSSAESINIYGSPIRLVNRSETSTYASNTRLTTSNTNDRIVLSTASSRKWKKDIKDVEDIDCTALYDLKVRQFKFREDYISNVKDFRFGRDVIGLIAEEVDEIFPIACDYDIDGEPENWNDRYMIPAILKLVQEQHIEIEALKEKLS